MLEKQLEAKIVKIAKKLGYLTYKFTSPSNRGVPDRIFINQYGYIFFIEFKSENGKLTGLQKKVNGDLGNCGVIVFVVSKVESGTEILTINSKLNPGGNNLKVFICQHTNNPTCDLTN